MMSSLEIETGAVVPSEKVMMIYLASMKSRAGVWTMTGPAKKIKARALAEDKYFKLAKSGPVRCFVMMDESTGGTVFAVSTSHGTLNRKFEKARGG